VISVAVLTGGGVAGYYTRAKGCERELPLDLDRPLREQPGRELEGPERDPVGYYVNGHDLPGVWIGRGAQALGLTGRFRAVDARVLQELLDGSHHGQALVPPVWRTGPDGERVDRRRAGFDVTFSAPKSVSTLMALAPPEVVEQVVAAHREATEEALRLLEVLAARVARGHQGDGQRAPRIDSDGLVAAAFTHTTSRALDPQLHTHVVVANLARGTDGRWSALDSRTLHREAITASALYHHRLRAELTERLGVAWTPIDRGVAEIDGIPLAVRREFSTRRRQIEQELATTPERPDAGTAGKGRLRSLARAAQAACLRTRPVKRHLPEAELREQWAKRATAAGLSPAQLLDLLQNPAYPPRDHPAEGRVLRRERPGPQEMSRILEHVLSGDGVTRQEATFTQGRLLRELIEALPPGAPVPTGELLGLTAGMVRGEEVVPVITEDGRAYATRDLLHTEAETLALATRTDQQLARLDPEAITPQLVRRGQRLRPEQQRLTYALLARGLPVEVVSGPAGCGKTAGLALARDLWTDAGLDVRGTAVAALTAQGLEQAAGCPSVSLSRVLTRPEEHLPERGVLLVDEAGMVGTRQLHRLLTLAQERECKVVLVGDPLQLPEIDAGGMFARLTQRPQALTLDGHLRQRHQWERDALDALRRRDIPTVLDAYRQHGRLHTRDDPDELRQAAVTAYLNARDEQQDPWQTVLLAPTREDVTRLNVLTRAALLQQGQLGRDEVLVDTADGETGYRTGDQVLVTRNDHHRGLLNGTTAHVRELHRDGLTLQTSHGARVRVSRKWLEDGRLDHAYAMTLHKAQGRTVHTALLVGGDLLSSQAGYVGLSRGTHANHLYLDTRQLDDLTRDCSHPVRHRKAEIRQLPGPLSRDARQRLALERRLARPMPVHRLLREPPRRDFPDVGSGGR
jgi:conjugative relaxase-like TrwC/TraI family protein